MPQYLLALIALLSQPVAASAQVTQPGPRAGDVYEIRRVSDMTQSDGNGSSGSSHDADMLVERVIAVRDSGVEVEFDLPTETSAEDRARQWQFPARVLRPPQGPLQLLNAPELTARVDRWLALGSWTRAMCGRWIFTWNAFQIECEPQSVVAALAAVELRQDDVRDGATYRDPVGRGEAVLRREAGSAAFVAELAVDSDVLRRQQAESDAVLREIMGDRSPALRAAREARAPRRTSGTVRIRFERDDAARTLRRTRVLTLETERMDGVRENRTVTETVERQLVSEPAP